MRKQQWTKTGKNWHGSWRKSERKMRGDRWSKVWGQNRALPVINGHLSSQEFRVRTKKSKIQRSCSIPMLHCQRWFRLLRSIYRARFINVTSDGSKSNGCHIKATRMRRTSSGRSICLYPGKNGRRSKSIENSKIGMSRHLDSSTTTQMA